MSMGRVPKDAKKCAPPPKKKQKKAHHRHTQIVGEGPINQTHPTNYT